MDDISDIKEMVAQALTRKRVLSKLRAELRSHVFVTIEEEESGAGGEGLGKKTSNPARESFVATRDGQLVVDLVHEFLQWANMEFTLRVFEPELGQGSEHRGRGELARQLDLAAGDGPLLLALLLRGGGGSGGSGGGGGGTSLPSRPPPMQPPPAPAVRAAPAPSVSAPPKQEESVEEYSDDLEDETELETADVVQEDEDYSSAVASRAGQGAGSSWSNAATGEAGARSNPAGSSVFPGGSRVATRPINPQVQAAPADDDDGAMFGPSFSGDIVAKDEAAHGQQQAGDALLKPRGLAPLAPLGKPALAPLGALPSLPGQLGKKPAGDIKDELRKAGLLTLPDSASESSVDMQQQGGGGEPAGPSRLSAASIAHRPDLGVSLDVGRSLDLHDTGLIPSDRSGDVGELNDADYVETAEWE